MAKHTLSLPSTRVQQLQQSPVVEATEAVDLDPSPYLGASVIVRTPEKIGRQNEHAAFVTKVIGGYLVNVLLMPDSQQPYPVSSVNHTKHSTARAPSWRWPDRV